jgi:hypothetical protein
MGDRDQDSFKKSWVIAQSLLSGHASQSKSTPPAKGEVLSFG